MTGPTVLVVGAGGQLGAAAAERLRDRCELVALTHADLDITDDARVAAVVARHRPDVVLNCAAYNAVDRAEREAAAALAVNAFGVDALARAAAAVRATLVHYSTDFVFDGLARTPYVETDRANPLSVYGQSKLTGEWLALESPAAYVLRVESLFGGPAARSSVDRIVASLASGQPARVFTDRVVSPSYVEDVVEATWQLLERRAAPGLYHVVNSGAAAWYDVGAEIVRLLGHGRLEGLRAADVPLPAARPLYSALSNDKLRTAGIVMPSWQDAIARHVGSGLAR